MTEHWKSSARHDIISLGVIVSQVTLTVLTVILVHLHPSWWTLLLGAVYIATRQHALGIMLHEAWHAVLFRNRKVNDFVGAWLLSYPLITVYWPNKEQHLEHHRKFGKDKINDPDRYFWGWEPSEKWALAREIFMRFSGLTFAQLTVSSILGKKIERTASVSGRPESRGWTESAPEKLKRELGGIVFTQLALVAMFAHFFGLTTGILYYTVLWLWPAAGIQFGINWLRQVLEHRDGYCYIFHPGAFEKLIFAPLNFEFHGVHHEYPAEPWYRLPSRLDDCIDNGAVMKFKGTYFAAIKDFFLHDRDGRFFGVAPDDIRGEIAQEQPAPTPMTKVES